MNSEDKCLVEPQGPTHAATTNGNVRTYADVRMLEQIVKKVVAALTKEELFRLCEWNVCFYDIRTGMALRNSK